MRKNIILRTHGGFGNQLFQLFYALCFSKKHGFQSIFIIHDANYEHSFQLEEALRIYCGSSIFERCVSRLRIPKILSRLRLSNSGVFFMGRTAYLDAYFQDEQFYFDFDNRTLEFAVECIKNKLNLNIENLQSKERLLHIRLKDFFSSEDQEYSFCKKMLGDISEEVDVLTNNEDMVRRALLEFPDGKIFAKIICSKGLCGKELLKMMGKYKTIESNGSTLAFWAAFLFARKLKIFGSVNQFNFLFLRLSTRESGE